MDKFISSDRSYYSDDGLSYIYQTHFFQIFTQSLDAIDFTSVTLSHSKVAYVNMDDG